MVWSLRSLFGWTLRFCALDEGRRRLCHWRRDLPVAFAFAAGFVTLAMGGPVASAAATCVNEAIRAEQGAAALALPECRAYELVTPPGEHPNLDNSPFPVVDGGSGDVAVEASAAGGAVVFESYYSPSGSPSEGHIFESWRGAAGWSTKSMEPNLGPQRGVCLSDNFYSSVDLVGEVLVSNNYSKCASFEPPLVLGESPTGTNLLVRGGEAGQYALVNRLPEGVAPGNVFFQGASDDLSRVVFTEEARLTPEAPAGNDLYEWDEGALRLVTYLPNGTVASGRIAAGLSSEASGFGNSPVTLAHAVSSDGERVVFSAGGALYVRVNAGREQSALLPGSTQVDGAQCAEPAKACTIQLDASHGAGASGSGEFWRASVDGSRIFFTDESRLTSDSTAAAKEPDLYEYSLATGELTDLTVGAGGEAADVLGVAGASEDGGYLYFVARGVLSTAANSAGETAERRKPNLYVLHAGTTSFIATLGNYDQADWGITTGIGPVEQMLAFLTSETSSDGDFIAFNSIRPLTGYENTPAEPQDCEGTTTHQAPGEPCNEVFRYDALDGRLSCVSCGQTGSAPTGIAVLRSPDGTFARRALSADGSVFFDTPSPLLGQDTNGVYDVYEWSPVGVGSCTEGSATFGVESGGCLYSISSGTSPEPSYFVDASESGEDAYFVTSQGLVAADSDNELSLYDARVGGGFAAGSGEAVLEPACASAEACKPPPGEAPALPFAASGALSASGNLAAPPVPVTPAAPQTGGPVVGKRALTRAQKLAQALRSCARRPRDRRAACRRAAQRKYGSGARTKPRKPRAGKPGAGKRGRSGR